MTAYIKVALAVVGILIARAHTNAAATQPLIVAHRGLLRHAPENTRANFRACLELRLGFEFDVERTKDGHLICIHDSTVDRTTNGTGKVSELTLAQIRELDAGSWFDPKFAGEKVPTVDEVLKLVADYRQHDVLIAVDLKAENVGQDVVRLAEKHKVLHRLLFIGRTITEPKLREQIKEASDKAHTAAVANNAFEFTKALAARSADWVYVRYLPTKDEMEAVHRAGKRAFIAGSTVSGDLPKNWQHCARVGIDAILTDYPLLLRTTLRNLKSDSDQAVVPAPVEARLVAKQSKYVLAENQRGEAFRKRIEEETDADKLPAAQKIDLVLELKNVSKEDVMIWPRGAITTPDLEVDGPGIVGPESLTGASGGGSGTSVQPTIATGMSQKSDEAGFIAVYPNGTGLGPFLTWNAGGRKGKLAEESADDVKYVGLLLDDLAKVANVDSQRVYATGMSNGGMMCYRLAAEMSDRIAAIAPVAGTVAVDESKPKRPVPVMHFHGKADLEMLAPSLRDVPAPRGGLTVSHAKAPSVPYYRCLYDAVLKDYHWLSRRKLPDEELAVILNDPRNELHVLHIDESPAGFAELDRRQPDEIELVQFGLMPDFIGRGIGKWFLHWTIDKVWSYQPKRFWLHTCTLDHPAALPTYKKAGFVQYKEEKIHREL